jgi:hypothetical protein
VCLDAAVATSGDEITKSESLTTIRRGELVEPLRRFTKSTKTQATKP